MPRSSRRPTHAGSWYEDDGEICMDRCKCPSPASSMSASIQLANSGQKNKEPETSVGETGWLYLIYIVLKHATLQEIDWRLKFNCGLMLFPHRRDLTLVPSSAREHAISFLASRHTSSCSAQFIDMLCCIFRHAGYSYCGHVMAHAYKQISSDQV